jgi:REP element-mobilizing transposase RayT
MSRPLRIEYPGAVYEITVRGNAGMDIFKQDDDRLLFLQNFGRVCKRFGWKCYAYCLLNSEYQLLIETPKPNLSQGMREVNGVFTQAINRKYQQRGHIFEGRFQSIVVDKKTYLAEIHRKLALMPVYKQFVDSPLEWNWSHYRGIMGKDWAPSWLSWKPFLKTFSDNTGEARRQYAEFVAKQQSQQQSFPIKARIILGSESFIEKVQNKVPQQILSEKSLKQQNLNKSLTEFQLRYKTRNEAIREAYNSGDFTLKQIGEHFKLHYTSVSRIAHKDH